MLWWNTESARQALYNRNTHEKAFIIPHSILQKPMKNDENA
jgi:hypothetical protein